MKPRAFLESAGPLIGLAFVAIIFGLLVGPQFFRANNLELIARQTAIVCTAALGMTMVMSRAGFEAENINDFRGLNQRHPWFALVTLLFMFALAGVPPTVGFYAKLAVLQAAVGAGYIWLAVVAVIFSLIGAFYYLRIVKLMYFDSPVDHAPLRPAFDLRALMSVNGLAMIVLGIMPQGLMEICLASIKALAV